jgi:flavin reductase (DIM6/NTAB) family NADH-FMN oxidoreductase RutF
MNASAAPLGKGLSEFNLIKSSRTDNDTHCKGIVPTYTRAPTINAPMVNESPVVIECKYVKTSKIPDIFENDSMYSLIIGEVVNVHVKNDFELESSSSIECHAGIELDVRKAKPVARLGYGQEYAVIDDYLNTP